MKGNLFEGGVRGVAAIWSPLIVKPHRVSRDLITIQDLLPTLLSAASGMSVWCDLLSFERQLMCKCLFSFRN